MRFCFYFRQKLFSLQSRNLAFSGRKKTSKKHKTLKISITLIAGMFRWQVAKICFFRCFLCYLEWRAKVLGVGSLQENKYLTKSCTNYYDSRIYHANFERNMRTKDRKVTNPVLEGNVSTEIQRQIAKFYLSVVYWNCPSSPVCLRSTPATPS